MSIWRTDFPALTNGTYLDSAATAHKPQFVIDTVAELMGAEYATVSRGLYKASQDMTARYEAARGIIARFINASDDEVVFTKNATEGFNLLARTLVKEGNKVVITTMEHHANIVPWQLAKCSLGILPLTTQGELDLNAIENFITKDTKVFSFTAASNVLGTINPVDEIVKRARAINPQIIIIVDASQAVVHQPINVRDWDCDFLVFTGHKLYGPTGVGVLFGKAHHLEEMPPFLGGGDMVDVVTFENTTFRPAPHKFESGTPNFIEVIGLAEAITYLNNIGWNKIITHENDIKEELFAMLRRHNSVKIMGSSDNRLGLASFTIKGCHPQDVAMILDKMNVAVRVGHHCAMPLLQVLGESSLIRASTALYTNQDDITKLEEGLSKAERMLA